VLLLFLIFSGWVELVIRCVCTGMRHGLILGDMGSYWGDMGGDMGRFRLLPL
jgi:hypothetical protein